MKLVLMTLALLSTQALMARPMTYKINKEDCQKQCSFVAYDFNEDFMGNCRMIEKCDVLEWNEEVSACEVVLEDQYRAWPIACRDIPPL